MVPNRRQTEQPISKGNPQEVLIPRSGENAGKTLIYWPEAGQVYEDKGLVLGAEKGFYVNYRVEGEPHAGSFTSKGRTALGTSFRTGHLVTSPIPATGYGRLNFLSFMATKDNTSVTISDLKEGIEIAGINEQITSPFTVKLANAGDTYIMGVFSGGGTRQQEFAIMGALIRSNNPIVVNCGSWVSSPGQGNHNDIGIEQIYPTEKIGKDYILVRGNGPDILETPIIVANSNGTKIFLNGNSIPYSTLNSGEFQVIPHDQYSSEGNMYIKTSKPVYVFQSTGGNNEGEPTDEASGSLSQIPPLLCFGKKEVFEIPSVSKIGDLKYSVSLSIINKKSADFSINNGAVAIGSPSPVPGNQEFETYKIDNISGDVTIESEDAIQIGVIGGRDYSGWSSYFSEFSQPKKGDITLSRENGCDDKLVAQTNVSGQIDWYLNDNIINNLSGTQIKPKRAGRYKAVLTYQFNCNQLLRDTSNIIVIENRPDLIIDRINICEPTGIEASDGSIDIYASGGSGEYLYVVSELSSKTENSRITGLKKGQYTIRVSDSFGCEVSQTIVLEALPFEVKAFPNPFIQEFYLSVESGINQDHKWELCIFDIMGRLVYTEEKNGQSRRKYGVNLGHLPAAPYVARFCYRGSRGDCGNEVKKEVRFRLIKTN